MGGRVCKLSSSTKTAICTLHPSQGAHLKSRISVSLVSPVSPVSSVPSVPSTNVVDDNFTCGFTLVERNNKRGRKVCLHRSNGVAFARKES